MVVGKRITWYTDILRWGRNWVCSGLSLGFIHGTWQRSRVSDLDYDCVAEFTTYNLYIYIYVKHYDLLFKHGQHTFSWLVVVFFSILFRDCWFIQNWWWCSWSCMITITTCQHLLLPLTLLISFYIFAQVEVSPSGAAGNSAMHLAVENCIKSSLMMSWVKRFESILV